MAHDPLKKVAILTGLTMVMGGAEVSGAAAATTTAQVEAFTVTLAGQSQDVSFTKFPSSLGTLTSVDFSLDSTLAGFGTANISVDNGVPLTSPQSFNTPFPSTVNYDLSFSGLVGLADTTFYSGTGSDTFLVHLAFTNTTELAALWNGQTSGETGLTLTYDYTPTPLPASLPLFVTGLAGLGLGAWRRRRKQKRA
jgi:hypothetical protein